MNRLGERWADSPLPTSALSLSRGSQEGKVRKKAGDETSVGSSFRPRPGVKGTEWKPRCDLEKRFSEEWARVWAIQMKEEVREGPFLCGFLPH